MNYGKYRYESRIGGGWLDGRWKNGFKSDTISLKHVRHNKSSESWMFKKVKEVNIIGEWIQK